MMDEPEIREYRYERKFLVDQLDAHQVRALVRRHPGMFYEPYPPRYVNNLYLDSEDMQHYFDNVAGAADRRKVRIRWYGDLFRDIARPMLEFKIKRGLVGTKHIYPFLPFILDDSFSHRSYQDLLRRADLPAPVKAYLRDLNVVLCNRYFRWYFATRDQRFRVTIDAEMTFYQVRRAGNPFVHKHVDHRNVVVELKYGKPLDVEAQRISGFFPFSVSKNSKYVTGIERVYV
jgi:hypothetical protein